MTYDPLGWQSEEINQLITPDGIVYSIDGLIDRTMPVPFDGQGTPPIEYATQQGPQQHGQTVISYRLQPRIMQGVFRWNARNRQGLWDERATLLNAIRPNRINVGSVPTKCVLRKIFPDYSMRDIDVLIAEGPGFLATGSWDEFSFEEPIRFIAHDPTFYDPTTVEVTASMQALSELSVPISVPFHFGPGTQSLASNIVYTGTWLTYPVITITGPVTAVIIQNTTTGEEIQFTKQLAGGQRAVIDTRFGYKTVVDPDLATDDPDYNLIGYVQGDLGTFHLDPDPQAPGGINAIQIYMTATSPDGSVVFAYNTRYFGI